MDERWKLAAGGGPRGNRWRCCWPDVRGRWGGNIWCFWWRRGWRYCVGYTYDAVGNRLTKTTGAATDTYAYSSTSNRIATITPPSGPVKSFVFDANGSTTNDAVNTYAYDTRGRMVQATSSVGTTTYQVNALGQRIRKTNSLGDTVFHYDAQGRLIAETDPSGTLKRELLYLGDIPVGVVQ